MADERAEVVRALIGPSTAVSPLPLAGLAMRMAVEALPRDLTLAKGVERLLGELDPAVRRRLLGRAAEADGLRLVRSTPSGGIAAVDKALDDADKLSAALRDFTDQMERDRRAVVVRSTDPGAEVASARCETCRAPKLVAAACLRLEGESKPWAVVVTDG